MRDSKKTQPLFDESIEKLKAMLKKGKIEENEELFIESVLKIFVNHTKIRNTEIKEDMLKYKIVKDVEVNLEGIKSSLKKQVPHYTPES